MFVQWFRQLGASHRSLKAESFCEWNSADAICVVSNEAKLEILSQVDDDPLAHYLYRRLVSDRSPVKNESELSDSSVPV